MATFWGPASARNRARECWVLRRMLPLWTLASIVLSDPTHTSTSAADIASDLDSDRDGLVDVVELRSGTDHLDLDSDGDGVPDGVEDSDRDGIVDQDESDPRVPGLFPGQFPHIPEPLLFDLVRGLGSRAGEVEVNTLLVTRFRAGRVAVDWAPEVEWAFADGLALELELPMHERQLEAIKLAGQVTLPSSLANLTHGLQFIGEYLLTPREIELVGLYLAGVRFGVVRRVGSTGGDVFVPAPGRGGSHRGQYRAIAQKHRVQRFDGQRDARIAR